VYVATKFKGDETGASTPAAVAPAPTAAAPTAAPAAAGGR